MYIVYIYIYACEACALQLFIGTFFGAGGFFSAVRGVSSPRAPRHLHANIFSKRTDSPIKYVRAEALYIYHCIKKMLNRTFNLRARDDDSCSVLSGLDSFFFFFRKNVLCDFDDNFYFAIHLAVSTVVNVVELSMYSFITSFVGENNILYRYCC